MYVSLFFLICVTVYVEINLNPITLPYLIYHDEIFRGPLAPNARQVLLGCISENHRFAKWRSPSGKFAPSQGQSNYWQYMLAGPSPSLSTHSYVISPNDGSPSTNRDVIISGLWLCQLDNSDVPVRDILESYSFVGVYNRSRGNGKVIIIIMF